MVVALNLGKELLVMHMAYLKAKMSIYSIQKVQIAMLLTEKIIILAKYLDFTHIFLKKSAAKLFKTSEINKHAINLKLSTQSSYSSINSLGLVEIKTFKTYIKINLANGFIQLFKSLVKASILFVQKLDGSFYLYLDYQGLNNRTIKNWYLLPLIVMLLDQLDYTKQFT